MDVGLDVSLFFGGWRIQTHPQLLFASLLVVGAMILSHYLGSAAKNIDKRLRQVAGGGGGGGAGAELKRHAQGLSSARHHVLPHLQRERLRRAFLNGLNYAVSALQRCALPFVSKSNHISFCIYHAMHSFHSAVPIVMHGRQLMLLLMLVAMTRNASLLFAQVIGYMIGDFIYWNR